jgi:hypothetical protein
MKTISGNAVLQEVVQQLKISLPALIAGAAFWAPPTSSATTAKYPNVRRARKGDRPGPVGVVLDDNTKANLALKQALSHLGKFRDFAVCHIWPKTCYDQRYHTMPANLVILPRELAGLTDHNREIEQCLQYRAWELYGWHPEEEPQPTKPDNYPDNWREPADLPKESLKKPRIVRSGFGSRSDVLPIELHPSDPAAFRDKFIRGGVATILTYYGDRVEESIWECKRFSKSSNVIGNLRSRHDFRNDRWQELGITKVVVRAGCQSNQCGNVT